MPWTVTKEFHFDAAHSLPHLSSTHKCHHLHGHTYTVRVHCSGDLIPENSWVIDYADIKAVVQPLIDQLDHKNLNLDVDFMLGKLASTENLAIAIWQQIVPHLPVGVALHCVKLYETPRICVEYFGE